MVKPVEDTTVVASVELQVNVVVLTGLAAPLPISITAGLAVNVAVGSCVTVTVTVSVVVPAALVAEIVYTVVASGEVVYVVPVNDVCASHPESAGLELYVIDVAPVTAISKVAPGSSSMLILRLEEPLVSIVGTARGLTVSSAVSVVEPLALLSVTV